MLRANCLFNQILHDRKYLTEAERIAAAAEKHWFNTSNGAISDAGMFAHLLCESFLYLSKIDQNSHWREAVQRALVFVHEHVQDANGYYGERWEKKVEDVSPEAKLIYQASAARAYLVYALDGL